MAAGLLCFYWSHCRSVLRGNGPVNRLLVNSSTLFSICWPSLCSLFEKTKALHFILLLLVFFSSLQPRSPPPPPSLNPEGRSPAVKRLLAFSLFSFSVSSLNFGVLLSVKKHAEVYLMVYSWREDCQTSVFTSPPIYSCFWFGFQFLKKKSFSHLKLYLLLRLCSSHNFSLLCFELIYCSVIKSLTCHLTLS